MAVFMCIDDEEKIEKPATNAKHAITSGEDMKHEQTN